jgi:hypothetical protein
MRIITLVTVFFCLNVSPSAFPPCHHKAISNDLKVSFEDVYFLFLLQRLFKMTLTLPARTPRFSPLFLKRFGTDQDEPLTTEYLDLLHVGSFRSNYLELSLGKIEGLRRYAKPKAQLQGFDFSNRGLVQANLQEADLKDCNLSGADLRNSNLAGADLRGANLTGAKLAGADLTDAKCYRANVSNTHFGPANTTLTSKIIRPGDFSTASDAAYYYAIPPKLRHPDLMPFFSQVSREEAKTREAERLERANEHTTAREKQRFGSLDRLA